LSCIFPYRCGHSNTGYQNPTNFKQCTLNAPLICGAVLQSTIFKFISANLGSPASLTQDYTVNVKFDELGGYKTRLPVLTEIYTGGYSALQKAEEALKEFKTPISLAAGPRKIYNERIERPFRALFGLNSAQIKLG